MEEDRGLRAAERGRWGEDRAAAYLASQGYTVCERGFRCRGGEIDIIAEDGPVVVFVEVKTRGPNSWDDGTGAVGRAKQQRLVRAARFYLARCGDRACRFDVITVRAPGGRIQHLKAAFDLS